MEYQSIPQEQLSRFTQIGLPPTAANFSVNPQFYQGPRISAVPPPVASSPPTSTSSDQEEGSDNESSNPNSAKKRQRGNYKCSKCGQPKKGHSCPFFPSESGSPTDPSTPETDHSVGGPVGSAPSSAPSSLTAQNILAMASSSIEDQQLLQRIRELEQENYMIHNENYQLRERLISLGYGNHLAQPQFQPQNYLPASQQYQQRPQTHVPVGVGIVPTVPVGYAETPEWDYAGSLKKRRTDAAPNTWLPS